jgi:hypothetical protein
VVGKLGLFVSMLMVTLLLLSASCVNKEFPVTETYMETEYRTETYTETEEVVVDTTSGEDTLTPDIQWHDDHMAFYIHTELSPLLPGEQPVTLPSIPYEKVWYFGYKIPQHDICHIQVAPNQFSFGRILAYDLGEADHIPPPPPGRWVYKEKQYAYAIYEWSDLYPWQQPTLKDWIASTNLKLETYNQLGAWQPDVWPGKWPKLPELLEFDAKDVKNLAIIVPMSEQKEPIKSVKLMWSDEVIEKRTVNRERQVPYQVERQRTTMEMKKVPVWEAIFGD